MSLPLFDAVSTNTPASGSSSTHTHTFAASATAVVNIKIRDGTTAPSVSTVTVGGVSASFVCGDSNFGDRRIEMWVCASPPSGAQSVVVTLGSSASVAVNVSCCSYTGCHATTPAGASATNESTGSETVVSVSVTTVNVDSLVVDCAYHTDDVAWASSGANQTQRENRAFVSGNDWVGVSEKSAATTGSYTMTWTAQNAGAWVQGAFELRTAAAGGGGGKPWHAYAQQ